MGEKGKKQVTGFKGAVYKGFVTEQEAIDYMEGNKADQRLIKVADDKHLTAYVDGSFSKAKKQYSFGCVFISPDGSVKKMNAPLNATGNKLSLDFYVDQSSVELIASDGLTSVTNLVFPQALYNTLSVSGANYEAKVRNLRRVWK